MTNKYAGKCVACGQVVPAGEGEIQAVVGQNKRWVVRHLAACPPLQADDDDDVDDDDDDADDDGPPPQFATPLERAAWTQFAFAFARVCGTYADATTLETSSRVLSAVQAAYNMLDDESQAFLSRPACAGRLAQLLTRLGREDMKQVSAALLMEVCF